MRMLTPGECSACAIRSAATNSGWADSSATTTTSLGPATQSIATWPLTYLLASDTYWLPGPTIMSTGGRPSTPYASAATACAPPTRYTSETPSSRQVASKSRLYAPVWVGGRTTASCFTPAAWAGQTVMSRVDG